MSMVCSAEDNSIIIEMLFDVKSFVVGIEATSCQCTGCRAGNCMPAENGKIEQNKQSSAGYY